MSYTPFTQAPVGNDAGGRRRVSLITTLFDGKSLSGDQPLIWENVGTGTGAYANNIYNMSVTAGQYRIRRARHVNPYFSGKSQILETTFDGYAPQVGVEKRVGYFSTSAVAPYNTVVDGFYLQTDSTDTASINIRNAGTVTATIPLAQWDNAAYFQNYNWDNFTVLLWDFLWLGGTELRLFIKTVDGFILAHTYKHASTIPGLFIKSPNQSIRYEIRSTTGTGSMNMICAAVGTEGSYPEAGNPLELVDTENRNTGSVGTIYALKGVKKITTQRDLAVAVTNATLTNNTTNDFGVGMILLNPTLSAPLTYVNHDGIADGTTPGTVTVTNVGRILAVVPSGSTGQITGLNSSILANIGMSITDVSDEIVLAYRPTTAGQAMLGTLGVKIY